MTSFHPIFLLPLQRYYYTRVCSLVPVSASAFVVVVLTMMVNAVLRRSTITMMSRMPM
nr:MAG TPA: hypothetical protein [Caudoviricetes sp.]